MLAEPPVCFHMCHSVTRKRFAVCCSLVCYLLLFVLVAVLLVDSGGLLNSFVLAEGSSCWKAGAAAEPRPISGIMLTVATLGTGRDAG